MFKTGSRDWNIPFVEAEKRAESLHPIQHSISERLRNCLQAKAKEHLEDPRNYTAILGEEFQVRCQVETDNAELHEAHSIIDLREMTCSGLRNDFKDAEIPGHILRVNSCYLSSVSERKKASVSSNIWAELIKSE